MIWLILTPSFWLATTIIAYMAYAIKNREFLAFTLTHDFWKSFLLGFFVGFFLGGILSFELASFILSIEFSIVFSVIFAIVFSIVFSILKTIFHSQKIAISDKKKKYQRINFCFMCIMAIPFVSSIYFLFISMLILSFIDEIKDSIL